MKRLLAPAMFNFLICISLAIIGIAADSELAWVFMAMVIIGTSLWYLFRGKNIYRDWLPALVLIAATATAAATPAIIGATLTNRDGYHFSEDSLKKFLSYDELDNFIRGRSAYYDGYPRYLIGLPQIAAPNSAASSVKSGAESGFSFNIGNDSVDISTDYSTTNVQVKGVDEADIVKTDGKYLYILSKSKVIVLVAYPVEEARVLSTIEVGENPIEIFVNGDRLVVFEGRWNDPVPMPLLMPRKYPQETAIKIYGVSDRENPILIKEINLSGAYFGSRMIGDHIYVIVNMPVGFDDNVIILPQISSDCKSRTIAPTEIYYFDNVDGPQIFSIIAAIDVQSGLEMDERVYLTTQANNMYVSLNNIYITYTKGSYIGVRGFEEVETKTVVNKISIANGKITYKYQAEVPGQVLNQFSMDEYKGYFRIATTSGEFWGNSARNNVYILGENLRRVGELEGLAPGERIYSARFMGNRVYLVTFKKVDPLFVIDLANPANPKVLGALKIPGYSDYLHPYDETHIIGVGKDTVDAKEGDFAYYQGVKVALFDVTYPENPKEISKYVIGERGTDSYALSDHRAFLFSKAKNLLVIPISLVEGGQHTWQGAYAFEISASAGLVPKARITHSDGNVQPGKGYDGASNYVMRSLYIDQVFYTISEGLVKMNELPGFGEIKTVKLG